MWLSKTLVRNSNILLALTLVSKVGSSLLMTSAEREYPTLITTSTSHWHSERYSTLYHLIGSWDNVRIHTGHVVLLTNLGCERSTYPWAIDSDKISFLTVWRFPRTHSLYHQVDLPHTTKEHNPQWQYHLHLGNECRRLHVQPSFLVS